MKESATEKLACNLGRRDEVPNIELAEYLVKNNDKTGIKEIVDGLKEKSLASDCIKVLYEIGERDLKLIASYTDDFVSCLKSKNNRLVWGGMTALAKIAECEPKSVFDNLPEIISAYKGGSVITIDNSISVFAGLAKAGKKYSEKVLPLLIDHLKHCRPKEVAQHAERASICFDASNAKDFINVLEKREQDLTPPQQKRVKKLLQKLHSIPLVSQ